MKIWPHILVFLALATTPGIAHAKPPQCSSNAVTQAKKLLNFHVGGDDRTTIDPNVQELPPLRNPANPRQKFQVLEAQGTIYKGQYRMRLIYFRTGSSCILMGQEVLEYANP